MKEPLLTRDGGQAGFTRQNLRNQNWDSSVHGVRIPAGALSLEDRCRMYAIRIPEAVFSHVTAALLQSIPLPWKQESRRELDIALPAPLRAPHAAGLIGHSLALTVSDLRALGDIRHTSAARTWCDLAGILGIEDLVAAGDYVIHKSLPLASPVELAQTSMRFKGRRGMKTIKAALPLLNDSAESRPESLLRVLLVQGGLPYPRINHTLVDSETGKHLRPDFIFEAARAILEYQGDYHRTKEQWRKDMTRRSRLEAAGWKVMELNWDDLKDPGELVSRIRAFLARS